MKKDLVCDQSLSRRCDIERTLFWRSSRRQRRFRQELQRKTPLMKLGFVREGICFTETKWMKNEWRWFILCIEFEREFLGQKEGSRCNGIRLYATKLEWFYSFEGRVINELNENVFCSCLFVRELVHEYLQNMIYCLCPVMKEMNMFMDCLQTFIKSKRTSTNVH